MYHPKHIHDLIFKQMRVFKTLLYFSRDRISRPTGKEAVPSCLIHSCPLRHESNKVSLLQDIPPVHVLPGVTDSDPATPGCAAGDRYAPWAAGVSGEQYGVAAAAQPRREPRTIIHGHVPKEQGPQTQIFQLR